MRSRAAVSDSDNPSVSRVIATTWACLEAKTRRKIVISAIIAAALAGLDAAAVGLLPTLVERVQGKTTGLFSSLSTPVVGGAVVVLLIVKSVCGALLLWWQAAFLADDESDRTVRLFRHLMRRPYGDTSSTNTSDYVRDLHISLPMLYRGSGAGLALIVSDGLGLLGLFVVVILRAPLMGAVLLVFLLGAAAMYSALIRTRVSRLSGRLHAANRDCLNDLQESFGALKTLKAFAAENVAIKRFRKTRQAFAITARDLLFYQQINRYYLEIVLVIVLGACLGVTYLVNGRASVLTSFGLLSGVAARAMPALARALTSVTIIKVAGASVSALEPDLRALEEDGFDDDADGDRPGRVEDLAPAPPGPGNGEGGRLVSLDQVGFRYPTAARDALREITLALSPGELVAIQGESGAGKTTLVDLLVGLLAPQWGTVSRPATASVGYVAQETFVWDDAVRFNVSLGRPPASGDTEAEIWASLEAAQLASWVRSLPEGLDAAMGERGGRISGGQRQRLGLARALYGRPSILVLDEPTSALDGETSRSLMSTLVSIKSGVGIIVVTHDPIVVEYADRTINLSAPAGQATG